MKKRWYIAYGSNLNLRQMAMRCPTARLLGTGLVENYELQFKGMPHGSFATIGPKKGASVPVGVWEITPRDEIALDVYEGYPRHYFKKNLTVAMEGQEVTAMAYIMNLQMNFGIPTQRYYNTVLEGYEQCGLDVAMLNRAVDASIERYRQALKEPFWNEEDYELMARFDGDIAEPQPEEDMFPGQLHL